MICIQFAGHPMSEMVVHSKNLPIVKIAHHYHGAFTHIAETEMRMNCEKIHFGVQKKKNQTKSEIRVNKNTDTCTPKNLLASKRPYRLSINYSRHRVTAFWLFVLFYKSQPASLRNLWVARFKFRMLSEEDVIVVVGG